MRSVHRLIYIRPIHPLKKALSPMTSSESYEFIDNQLALDLENL